jgi:protein involved in polysaccharide export with SLBB domain
VNNPGLLSFIEGEDVMDYIDRAGGLTDSSNYAVLIKPTGESRRVNFGWFTGNPEVPEGSLIEVLRVPPPPAETHPADIAGTIKDTIAILTSAATLAFIVWEVSR